MAFLELDDVRLYYEIHGPAPGTAPVLVFAHGMGGNHLSWWQQVAYFRDRYTCVTFDHRGFGRSLESAGGPGGAAFVDDLRALLDHLGIARANLIAQSMGGWTCLGFAVRFADRVERLVMCDTHGGLADDALSAAWMEQRRFPSALPESFHPAAGARMSLEQPALHFLYTQINDLNPSRTIEEMAAVIVAAGTIPAPAVAALDIPVLLIAGEEDIVIPPRVLELAQPLFRHARLERVPAAGHSVYFERSAVFNKLIEHFIATPPGP